ncbi:hypothetical protein GE061_015096 [Apolygus lucorum]|uniref:Uncharacterized protein n=1 Tax=Apolygus lucorum TaxID=248454 RepID=A0A8S9XL54_APOLU|nr:hypothetical protein GE061_015096 [Apolygus lucorum]
MLKFSVCSEFSPCADVNSRFPVCSTEFNLDDSRSPKNQQMLVAFSKRAWVQSCPITGDMSGKCIESGAERKYHVLHLRCLYPFQPGSYFPKQTLRFCAKGISRGKNVGNTVVLLPWKMRS